MPNNQNKNNPSIDDDDEIEIPLLILPDLSDSIIDSGKPDEEIIASINFTKDKNFVENSTKTRRANNPKIKNPPRPLNSYFLYMKVMRSRVNKAKRKKRYSKNISKKIGQCWKDEPAKVRKFFKICARVAKKKHSETYKNYKYERRVPQKRVKGRRNSQKTVHHSKENEQMKDLAAKSNLTEQIEELTESDIIDQIDDLTESDIIEQMEDSAESDVIEQSMENPMEPDVIDQLLVEDPMEPDVIDQLLMEDPMEPDVIDQPIESNPENQNNFSHIQDTPFIVPLYNLSKQHVPVMFSIPSLPGLITFSFIISIFNLSELYQYAYANV
jgi:hypothetical protein